MAQARAGRFILAGGIMAGLGSAALRYRALGGPGAAQEGQTCAP